MSSQQPWSFSIQFILYRPKSQICLRDVECNAFGMKGVKLFSLAHIVNLFGCEMDKAEKKKGERTAWEVHTMSLETPIYICLWIFWLEDLLEICKTFRRLSSSRRPHDLVSVGHVLSRRPRLLWRVDELHVLTSTRGSARARNNGRRINM